LAVGFHNSLYYHTSCDVFILIHCKVAKVLLRDRPKLIFINSAVTETGPKYSNVVSAENETEAEFNILFTAETETENQLDV